ncbi:MAG: hypothetical protein GY804_04320 [Alphaproteobacteria bacterium]|nr:hypothetical protein [Alphaproteobacteria bacterium]
MNELVLSNLDLFSPVPVQLSVSESKFEKIGTKTALDGNTPLLEFTAGADKVYYTDLSNSFIYIKCKYVTKVGGAISGTPKIGPIQYPVTSLFKSIDLYLNDVKISPNESNLHYIHFLYNALQSQQAKDSYLTLGLWYDDDYSSLENAGQANPQEEGAKKNKGLKKRADYFGSSREVELIGKICIAPHMCEKLFLPNCKFDWKFEMNNMELFSMTEEDIDDYRFVITDASILLKRVAVSPSVSMAHAQLLSNQNCILPCKYLNTRTFNIGQNLFDFKYENAYVGNEMPISIWIGFVRADAKFGDKSKNPFVFEDLKMSQLVIWMGTKRIPAIEYKMNPDQNQIDFGLFEAYQALDCYGTNVGPGNFNRETFDNGLFFLAFDLSRDGNPESLYRNSSFEATNVSIQGQFKTATQASYTSKFFYKSKSEFKNITLLVIAIAQFHGQLEMNRFMTPFTSWA